MRSLLALTLLCVACDAGKPPVAADDTGEETDPPDTDTGAPDSDTDDTDTDDTDTGETDTDDTDSVDTETGDTDTDDTASIDTSLCDPEPYLTRETGDTGTGPEIPWVTPDTGEDTAYRTAAEDDCDVSVVSEAGHPLLACFGTTLDTTLERSLTEHDLYYDEAEWLGDLDGDGYSDALLRALNVAGDDTRQYVIYGGPVNLDRGRDLAPETLSDAWTGSSEVRSLFGGGDFNGDGFADLLVASAWVRAPDAELGVYFGNGSRWSGEVSSWGTIPAWTETDNWYGTAVTWPGASSAGSVPMVSYRRANASDLDADGLTDIIMSHSSVYQFAGDTSARVGVLIVRGDVALAPEGELGDAATWALVSRDSCADEYGDEHPCRSPMATPLGDVDGDGDNELGVVNRPYVDSASSGVYYDIVDIASLAPCDYEVSEIYDARLEAAEWTTTGGWDDSSSVAAPLLVPVGDLNGDGLADTLATVPRNLLEGGSIYLLYGGEEWVRSGGDLRTAPDRIDYADPASLSDWFIDAASSRAADLDGDGSDELMLSGILVASGISSEHDARAGFAIMPGTPTGLRGILGVEDAELSVVTSRVGDAAMVSRGTGDIDGDGADDLIVSTLEWPWSLDRYDRPIDSYPVWSAQLVTGAELAPYLP